MAVKRIDHVAVVLPAIEDAITFYRDALGLDLAYCEHVDDQDVTVAFFALGDSKIELVQPITDTSGVARYLETRGEGLHHICLEVDDLDSMLANLKAWKIELIDEEPRTGSGGARVAFVHPRSAFGVLVELVEPAPRRKRPTAGMPGDVMRTLSVESRAMWAGVSAFWHNLRQRSETAPEGGSLSGNGNGITLKAEGEILED